MIEKITEDKIILERLKLIDSESIYQAIIDSRTEISPWLNWLHSGYSLNECQSFIRIQINNWESDAEYTFVIKNKSNEVLGLMSLHVYDSQNSVASIGYWINTEFTNKGVCTKALKLLILNAFNLLNLNRIEVIVATTNLASQKVVLKAGGAFESVQKNRIKLQGEAVDAHMYYFTSIV